MTHYFSDNSDLKENRQEHTFSFYGYDFIFTTDNGVFSKKEIDRGSIILLEALYKEDISGKIIDLGCGYGVISIVLKKIKDNTDVTAVDINPRAVELTELNSKRNKVDIKNFLSDGFEEVNDTFDIIVSNPPIRTGKKVIYQLFRESFNHLNTGGYLYLVIRRKQGAESAVKELEAIFSNCEVIARDKGYWILKSQKV